MSFGIGELQRSLYHTYRNRLDMRAVLVHYGAQNCSERPGRDGTTEVIHSCILDRIEPHHAHGDVHPSAAANLDKKLYCCIAPTAWVMTLDGGKPIEEIVIGDMVLTHQGRYRSVTRTYSRYIEEDVIEYRPNGSRSFLITKDHKMLTALRRSCGRCGNPHKGCRHLTIGDIGWHHAEEIANHVVVRGKLTEIIPVDRVRIQNGPIHGNNNIKAEWVNVTLGLMRLIGYYLAEGNSYHNGVQFSLNPEESNYADDIESLLEECFGVSSFRRIMRGGLYVVVSSRGLSRFFVNNFGTGCGDKLLPSWVMTLPKNEQLELLRGLYRGDGSVSENHQSTLTLANPKLVYQVWQLLTRFDAMMSLSQKAPKVFSIKGYVGMARSQATIRWGDNCSQDFREINDKSKYPFRERWIGGSRQWFAETGEECVAARWREVPYSGMVYDLEVDEDHSFVVEGVVSSNCYSYWSGDIFHLIAKMEGKEGLEGIAPVVGRFLIDATVETDSLYTELEKMFVAPSSYSVELPSYSDQVLTPWLVEHPYWKSRGISPEVVEKLKLGYDFREDRVVFPHFFGGQLVGWQKRITPLTQPSWPKYRNSISFPKAESLYNYDIASGYRRVVVVESPMSVARALSLSVPAVVATFGAKVSPRQIDLLRGFDGVWVWFDADSAGHAGERQLVRGLYRHTDVRVVIPEEGRDMADVEDGSQLACRLLSAVPAAIRLADYDAEGKSWATRG